MRPYILVDTGFWYALLTPRDHHHEDAKSRESELRELNLVIPWPSLYETLNTRIARNPIALKQMGPIQAQQNVHLLDDRAYRDKAYELFLSREAHPRNFSLVDWVIRLMLDDVKVVVTEVWSYNKGDFADICRKRGIGLR